MQLEHERQPPGTVLACGPQPSPAQLWQPVPTMGLPQPTAAGGAKHTMGVAGDGTAGLSLWNPSSPQHHAAHWQSRVWGLTHLSPISHSPVLGTAQTGAT